MPDRLEIAGSSVTTTRVGFGCARLYSGIEQKTSARLIEAALTAGIRHFDTAPMYGLGRSEDVLGDVLRGVPDITFATKVGIERPGVEAAGNRARLAYRRYVKPLLTQMPGLKAMLLRSLSAAAAKGAATPKPRRRLSEDYIRRELEESLRRLKRDHVDLYMVHEPDQFDLDDEALEAFSALKREGLVRAFGLAYGRSVEETPEFGTIVQSQFRNGSYPKDDDKTRVFHGVLRHGWGEVPAEEKLDIGAYFRKVLDAHSRSVFIFSASSPHQIAQLTAMLSNKAA